MNHKLILADMGSLKILVGGLTVAEILAVICPAYHLVLWNYLVFFSMTTAMKVAMKHFIFNADQIFNTFLCLLL